MFNFLLTVFSRSFICLLGRERKDPKSKFSQKKSKYSPPVGKRKDSPAKFHREEEFSPERAPGHLSSEYRGYDDDIDWSKKVREIKR